MFVKKMKRSKETTMVRRTSKQQIEPAIKKQEAAGTEQGTLDHVSNSEYRAPFVEIKKTRLDARD